jgi:DNA-binding IclR family transcriptional regulator
MELLATRRKPLRATDMAELGVPKGSLNRILRTLVDKGWLDRNEMTVAYTLSRKLLQIGSVMVGEKNLTEEALGVMRELRDVSGETVQLNVLMETQGVVLEVVLSKHPIRLMVDPGVIFSLHSTAPGKTLLAFLPPEEQEKLLPRLTLSADTTHSITSLGELRKELRLTCDRGWSVDCEEVLVGVRCVAAPIRGGNGACIAALTLTGPSSRMPLEAMDELGRITAAHADRISGRMGYVPR